MKSIQPEMRKFLTPGAVWSDGTLGQSWQCAVLWGSLVLETLSGSPSRYRLPDLALPTTCNSTSFCRWRGKSKRPPAAVHGWVN